MQTMFLMLIFVILLIMTISSYSPYYRYNILRQKEYKVIKRINEIKPEEFELVYNYDGIIKLKDKNSQYILYGDIYKSRAYIFYNEKCLVSSRPIESIKLFEKYCLKYLV